MKNLEIEDIKDPQSVELLKALHILTMEGKINQDSRRKLKQVYHLFNFIEPLLLELQAQDSEMTLVDHGAGKSYLGFIIYDLFYKKIEKGHIYGVESREKLVQNSLALQKKTKFERMTFMKMTVKEAFSSDLIPKKIDLVTALHACDTATDEAIDFALNKEAKYLVLVPCCQAEVAQYLKKNKAKKLADPLTELWRHAIHTREFGSHVTNVLRCLKLEAHGYQVSVTELVGLEHSLKNELILAHKIEGPRKRTSDRIKSLLFDLGLQDLENRFLN